MPFLNEIPDSKLKLRVDVTRLQSENNRLRLENKERDELIGKLSRDVASLTLRFTKLVHILGTKTK